MGERAGREGRRGGVPNSRELRGAYGLHGNTRQPGEKAGFGNPGLEVLKMKASRRKLPPRRRKASSEIPLSALELPSRRPCGDSRSLLQDSRSLLQDSCRLLQTGRTRPSQTAASHGQGRRLSPAALTPNHCPSLYQNVVSLHLGFLSCRMRQLKGIGL